MAGFIKIRGRSSFIRYHIGESRTTELEHLPAQDVESIQADGDELYEIQDAVKGIPSINLRVVTYYGDDARFIARNLLKLKG